MVTSVFKKEDVILALDLPSLHAKSQQSDKKTITVELSKTLFAIEGQKHQLKDALELFTKYKKSTNILIRIDKDVKYARVMKLFDTLQQNQLTKFSLVAQKNNDK